MKECVSYSNDWDSVNYSILRVKKAEDTFFGKFSKQCIESKICTLREINQSH